MDKINRRVLAKIPRPEVTEQLIQNFHESYKSRGIVTAQWFKAEGQHGIIVNVFRSAPQVGLKPAYRIFCQLDGDITQDLETDKTKWLTGTYAHLNGESYYPAWGKSFTDYGIATAKDYCRIENWISIYQKKRNKLEITADGFNDLINAYQNDIRDRRRIERNKKILNAIDQKMALFGDLPEDYPEFVENKIFNDTHFIFYSRKKKFAYCTRCGSTWTRSDERQMEEAGIVWPIPIDSLRHNTDHVCPICGHIAQAKGDGMGRQQLVFVRWSVLVQASGEDVIVRYIRHVKDFSKDYRKPLRSDTELFRTVHGADGQESFEWGTSMITRKERWIYPRSHYGYFSPSEYSWPRETVLYNTDWGFLTNTRMRYSCTDMYIDNIAEKIRKGYASPWEVDRWFLFYSTYPYMEQFMKLGWYGLVNELMYEAVRPRSLERMSCGRTVCQTLGINKERLNYLRMATENYPRVIDLEIMWYAQQIGLQLSAQDHKDIRIICTNVAVGLQEKLLDLCLHTTPHKLVAWLLKQKEFRISDYIDDYIRWCQELNVNLDDEYNLLPPNFKRQHDEMYMRYLAMTDKKKHEQLVQYNMILERMRTEMSEDNPRNMHLEGLFIRLPMRIEELNEEGDALHHCVGTYKQRVMDGKTMIFFIRKESEPNTPFYTLEWKDHRIVQCRGMRNCDMTPEVKAFTTIFSEKMREFETGTAKSQRVQIRAV